MEEMKQFVRRAGKMLPARIAEVRPGTVERSKQLFEDFRRDTDRSRLAADVEIKVSTFVSVSLAVDRFKPHACYYI